MKKCMVAFLAGSRLESSIQTHSSGGGFKQTMVALGLCLFLAASAHAQIRITEVAPWSSGSSPFAADWFELTNFGASSVDITGWTVDDSSASFGLSAPLTGISSIAAGESVIFSEGGDPAAFKTLWFGASAPAGLQIGSYSGGGLGLSTSGDGVTIFNSGGGTPEAIVTFAASPGGPFPTFDNSAGLNNVAISQLSMVGVNGAFVAVGDSAEIGSPGTISNVPEPGSVLLLVLGIVAMPILHKRRRVRS